MKRRRLLTIASIAASLVLIFSSSISAIFRGLAQQRASLTVSAAISLTNAMQEIKTIYQRSNSVNITYNFGASGALQRQIEQGAPVDVFFSAAAQQMNALQKQKLLVPGTRSNLLTNRLVLITPKNAPVITSFRNLPNLARRIAIGEPRSVPAGQYAQELLINLQILNSLKSKFVYGNNVRQVLTYVETGNVDAGIVYTTDATESNAVRVGATAPESLHSPIIYPVAVLRDSRNVAAAKKFVQFLSSSQAKAVFRKYGFGLARS